MTMDSIKEELEVIRSENENGELVAEDVVEFAKNPNTALHKKFNWDDTKAAHLYRLQQARGIIRVVVNVTKSDTGQRVVVPAFVSLSDNRRDGKGYQVRAVVISDEEKRRRHALDVLASVISLLTRAQLEELSDVLAVAQEAFDRISDSRAA